MSNIELVFKNHTSQKTLGHSFFKKNLEAAAKELKLNKDFSISVNLVGEKRIQALNKKYRNKNKPTDVLSFSMIEDSNLETRNKRQVRKSNFLNLSHITCRMSLIVDVGDIFVCLSIAKSKAKRENITIKQKLAQLVVHGFLHLQGYEHEKSEKDAKKMFLLEKKILSNN